MKAWATPESVGNELLLPMLKNFRFSNYLGPKFNFAEAWAKAFHTALCQTICPASTS